MNDNLRIFDYKGKEVRTVEKDGITWWVLKDVCNVLGLSNPTMIADRLDEDERAKFNLGRQGETNIVNESGLYNVILRSDKEEAKPFRKWVTSEVLPSIRKHGIYADATVIESMFRNPDVMIKFFTKLKTEQEQRIKLEKENALLIPDANMARDIIKYNGSYTLKEVADLIEKGRTELCTLLRTSEVLSKQTGYNLPLRRYTKQGYFKIKINEKTNVPVTLITAKGLRFIYRLIKKYDLVDEFDTDTLLETAKDMEMIETA